MDFEKEIKQIQELNTIMEQLRNGLALILKKKLNRYKNEIQEWN